MEAPHDRINFNLRPNKRIERAIVGEVLQCLTRYEDPSRYAYVGMGSYYFADFVLMHRLLGISKMVSIESDEENRARFAFNKPFACVEMRYGMTHDVLPSLEVLGERPVIAWLDYYGHLDDQILGDVETVAATCLPGSALILTVTGSTPAKMRHGVENFEAGLAQANRPAGYSKQVFTNDATYGEFCRKTISMRLQAVVADRNAASQPHIYARQVFNFRYADGLSMSTYGWLLLSAQQRDHLERDPRLLTSAVVSTGAIPVDIEAPAVTFREIAHLKNLLPDSPNSAKFLAGAKPVPKAHAKKFATLYRYFPSFAQVEE